MLELLKLGCPSSSKPPSRAHSDAEHTTASSKFTALDSTPSQNAHSPNVNPASTLTVERHRDPIPPIYHRQSKLELQGSRPAGSSRARRRRCRAPEQSAGNDIPRAATWTPQVCKLLAKAGKTMATQCEERTWAVP